jgi:hypothetical protein
VTARQLTPELAGSHGAITAFTKTQNAHRPRADARSMRDLSCASTRIVESSFTPPMT